MDSKILDLNDQTKYIFKECFDNNQSPKNIEVIDWQFFKNKNKNFVDIEFDDINKKASAIYATFGVKFKINSQILRRFGGQILLSNHARVCMNSAVR